MPKVRREGVPFALLRHLRDRVRNREISSDQLELLARWLDKNPEVPNGRWFKRFPEIKCGCGVESMGKSGDCQQPAYSLKIIFKKNACHLC